MKMRVTLDVRGRRVVRDYDYDPETQDPPADWTWSVPMEDDGTAGPGTVFVSAEEIDDSRPYYWDGF